MGTVVIFHRDADGYAAASVAYQEFGESGEYIHVQYGEDLPDRLKNATNQDDVYILDFSYSRVICEELRSKVNKLVILDHHETAAQELEGLGYAIFDMNHSGNMLAWKYFYPDKEPSRYHILTEDRDLWKFDHGDNTRALNLGIDTYGFPKKDTPNYLKFLCTLNNESNLLDCLQRGYILLKKQIEDVNKAKNARNGYKVVNFNDMKFIMFNTTSLISELSETYYLDEEINIPCTLSYFILNDKVVFSMRARKGSGFVVNEIAKTLGGGGHPAAAGFTLPIVQGLDLVKALLTQSS